MSTIKKVIIITTTTIILLFLFKNCIDYLSKLPCPEPEKPKNIPIEAMWKGGCDGGDWINIVERRGNDVLAEIYNRNGNLIAYGYYGSDSLDINIFSISVLKDCITYYDGEMLWVKLNNSKEYPLESKKRMKPERHPDIPQEAIWCDGCESGYWIKVIDKKGNDILAEVYFLKGNIADYGLFGADTIDISNLSLTEIQARIVYLCESEIWIKYIDDKVYHFKIKERKIGEKYR